MEPKPRNPAVLTYRAVRNAPTTADAQQIYDAMNASPCITADTCTMSGDCPFYVDCMTAEGTDDA